MRQRVTALGLIVSILIVIGLAFAFHFQGKHTETMVIVDVPQSIELTALEAYDSSDGKVSIPADLHIDSYPSELEGYYIVQFEGPIHEEHKAQVMSLGGTLFDYIPENAFIVKMNETTRREVENLEVIEWVGIYQPAYKISPALLNKTGSTLLTVLFFAGEDLEEPSHEIESLGGTTSVVSDDEIRVSIDGSMISRIANLIGVQYIEEYVLPTIP